MLQPGFVRGASNETVFIDDVVDHIDHVCQLAGNSPSRRHRPPILMAASARSSLPAIWIPSLTCSDCRASWPGAATQTLTLRTSCTATGCACFMPPGISHWPIASLRLGPYWVILLRFSYLLWSLKTGTPSRENILVFQHGGNYDGKGATKKSPTRAPHPAILASCLVAPTARFLRPPGFPDIKRGYLSEKSFSSDRKADRIEKSDRTSLEQRHSEART